MSFDPLTIGMLVVLAVLIIFMFRNSRKRKAQAEALKAQIVPGVEVMTNFGLYGTLKSIDAEANVAEIEVAPGTVLRVHNQTIAKAISSDPSTATGEPRSVEEAIAIANREAAEREAAANGTTDAPELDAPAYGERVDDAEKPGRKTKKTTE
jgi:preprotein translocase subunit YajC